MRYRHILSTAFFLPLIFLSFAYGQNFSFGNEDELDDEIAPVEVAEVEPLVKVILDPGHGGHDLGARSPKHILEKNIILKLANLIQQRLSGNQLIETIIDRPDDIHVTVLDRIKFANASRGDLFIGLHADGGMGPRAHPLKIFISKYEKPEQNKKDQSGLKDRIGNDNNDWARLNYPFRSENLKLARAIKRRMEKIGVGRDIDIEQTDKLMLGGLTMPAILIEPIDLSNPADEIRLENEVYITKISEAIAVAVEAYLQDAGKLKNSQ